MLQSSAQFSSARGHRIIREPRCGADPGHVLQHERWRLRWQLQGRYLHDEHQTKCRTVSVNVSPQTGAEHSGNEMRRSESGSTLDSPQAWQWTFNFNHIDKQLVIGSCPRDAQDLERISTEAHADAVVCLQCDDCLAALQVDYPAIRQRAADLNMLHVQVPIRDFDREDQARMLPEAVVVIAQLVSQGRTVYVHCTAGINRAPLSVIGYLSFVKGMDIDEAARFVKQQRPRANPYLDCLKDARAALLSQENSFVTRLASEKYQARVANNVPEDGLADWVASEKEVLNAIVTRKAVIGSSLLSSMQSAANSQHSKDQAVTQDLQREILELREQLKAVQHSETSGNNGQTIEKSGDNGQTNEKVVKNGQNGQTNEKVVKNGQTNEKSGKNGQTNGVGFSMQGLQNMVQQLTKDVNPNSKQK